MPRAASAGTPTLPLAPCGQGWGLHVSSILGTRVWPELCWSCRSLRCCHCPWADLGPVLQSYLQLLPTGLLGWTLILIPLVLVLLSAPDAVSPPDPVGVTAPWSEGTAPACSRLATCPPPRSSPTPAAPWSPFPHSQAALALEMLGKILQALKSHESHLGPSPSQQ